MLGNVTFHQNLLADDQRISRMNIEYWIDYAYFFGATDLIPLYDGVTNTFRFRNYDTYIFGLPPLWLFTQLLYTVFFCRCCCIRGGCCFFCCKCCKRGCRCGRARKESGR